VNKIAQQNLKSVTVHGAVDLDAVDTAVDTARKAVREALQPVDAKRRR
jgi:hypothetical protein